MSLTTGSRLGAYEIISPLGVGGMGEVYRARDTKLGRDVALKMLPEPFAADADRLARFQREAQVLASLNHPNIAHIYGLEESNGVRALVMELVDGPTLADRIARAPIPLSEALSIAKQIAEALDAAHEKGIVHRDLKPANVALTGASIVKVLDFGLAKAAFVEASAALTHSPTVIIGATLEGTILGTAPYMSPEQARGQVVDKRTDIWAFGCVLYEMLTGRAALARATVSDTIAAILEREPDWDALPATTPASIKSLLQRSLEKDVRRRLRDIGDALILFDLPLATADSTKSDRSASRVGWWMLGGAVLIGAVAGVAWLSRPVTLVPGNLLANAQFTRFTDFEGSETDAVISRDGKYVAFRADRDGPVDTWVSRVGSGQFINLTHGTQNSVLVRNMGFTPDGSEVWLSAMINGSRLRLMPVTGGSARAFLVDHAINPAWSPDGLRIVFHTYDAGDPMFVSDSTGANPQQIFMLGGGGHNHFPIWSVDGQWIYFVSGFWDARQMDVWRIRPSGGTPERLTHINTDVRYLAALDRQTLLYIAPDENGAGPWLWTLDAERKVSRRISPGLDSYTSVDATADGRRLVVTVANPSANVWKLPLLPRVTDQRDMEPFTLPTVRAFAPRFGGTALFYLSSRGGGDGLWRYDQGQSTEIWRGADGALLEPAAVSSDGRRVAIILRKDGKRTLHTLSAEGGDVRPLAATIDVSSAAAWSPDGKWIVAAGSDGKDPGLFKIPVEGGDAVRLAKGLLSNPVWSPDDSVIVYTGPVVGVTGPLLMVHPDATPVNVPPILVRTGGERYRFVPNRKELVYLRGAQPQQSSVANFWLLDLVTMKSRQLSASDNRATRTFDISPDGKEIIFDRLRDNADIVLIDLPTQAK